MAVLTVACKANHALLLPAILAATYANQHQADLLTTINFEDAKFVGPNKQYLKLVTHDGTVIYDQAVFDHLRESFHVLQLGNVNQVCDFYFGSRNSTIPAYVAIRFPNGSPALSI